MSRYATQAFYNRFEQLKNDVGNAVLSVIAEHGHRMAFPEIVIWGQPTSPHDTWRYRVEIEAPLPPEWIVPIGQALAAQGWPMQYIELNIIAELVEEA